TDEQQPPRRARSRRRNDDKRPAQQAVKAMNVEDQYVQEPAQEQRVRPLQPRRKPRQLHPKVRYKQRVAEEEVVATLVTEPVATDETEQAAATHHHEEL
ncbi:hypothetical protein, partial [Escherichia coli]|uniref:hypothetical protein n=1 Tax=Escherichia coli TaxID=562 RepID=UPI0011BAB5A8